MAANISTLALPQPRSPRIGGLWKFVTHQPLAAFGLLVLLGLILLALLAPTVLTKDPYDTSIVDRTRSPSSEHWFGTDNLGRDVFARTVLATRFSILLGLAATAVALVIGVAIGVGSGY